MRAHDDGGTERAEPDELTRTLLGVDASPLALLEGRTSLLDMDRFEIGTPLGDLEALSPR